jgi:hypothetical protein
MKDQGPVLSPVDVFPKLQDGLLQLQMITTQDSCTQYISHDA